MTTPPNLTDRPALERYRKRATAAPALFLHEALADEVQERLSEVNKEFTNPTVVGPWSQVWENVVPQATYVSDDDPLDLPVGKADLLIHALSLHWAADPVGQLVQCRHALKPDGMLIAALFGGRTLHELRASFAEAEARIMGGISPRVAPMGEIRDLGGLLQRAGFAMPVADVIPLTVTYETPWHLMRDLRAMGENNALAGRLRHPSRRDVFADCARVYSENFGTGDGRVQATYEIIVLTGWAPAENQPKALRPGSASQRLADALNSKEHIIDG